MKRSILALAVGLLSWFLVATVANWVVRLGVPGYATSEPSMLFTLPMLAARLVAGACASLAAGLVAARLAPGHPRIPLALGGLLLLLFLPVHYGLWSKFPVWYHAVFLLSLVPLVWAGARMTRQAGAASRLP